MNAIPCTIPCNLCGSDHAAEIGTRDRNGNPLRSVICPDCGLVWTDPRPNAAATRKFYAEDYRLEYKATYVPKLKHVYRESMRAIARFERIAPLMQPEMRLLDVGSGGGFLLYVAQQHGFEAAGIEPNQGFAEYANQVLDVSTNNGFLQDIEFQPGSFEVAMLNHVLEHVEDPYGTLQRLAGWLSPEGYLVVEVPNVEAIYHAPRNRYHVGHLYNFNPISLERLGLKAGLGVYQSDLVTSENHIHVIFQKRSRQAKRGVDCQIPGNFQRVSGILQRHTTFKHFSSPVPYHRFLRKQARYFQEWRAVRNQKNPRKIADALIQSTRAPQRRAA